MQLTADATRDLDAFMARLAEDVGACAGLADLFRDEEFAREAQALAAGWGMAAPGLAERLARRSVVARPAAPPAGWLPVAVSPGEDAVDWAFFGGRRLEESFFGESVPKVWSAPLNRLLRLRTPLSALEGLAGPAPDGLVFHMSRCGSTLLGRMLGAPTGATVLSEAAPIDHVVRGDLPRDRKVALLRGVVAALGRARGAGDERLFLKLDCWHALDFDLFREAFPTTPWLHLYRSPAEVMVSHARSPGMQMVPQVVAPAVFGLAEPATPDADYQAAVLAAIGEAMLAAFAADGTGLLVSYETLPGAVAGRVLPHFGWAPDALEHEVMTAAAAIDAKAPERAFAPDGAAKRAEVDPAIRAACAARLDGLHARLEAAGGPSTSSG
ncbi:aspartyl beta-hydroxylase [Caulobacter endophyticus]|uniref:aspartyl beta-hydroxylase n=1 Tax=Caulobacter endophyticus TaxID=2172652 RepID=UPI00240ECCEE|nr:aspartyl beta-hydroxylase [Caulobacter endophyticus]MDG2531204.1 aspartyl beta-hydroxylase [Caulobacter endophyticus]